MNLNLSNHIKNGFLQIKVIPNAPQTKLVETETRLKLYLKAPPEKGKANQELIKFFKKEYGLRVEVKSGEKSREKTLKILS